MTLHNSQMLYLIKKGRQPYHVADGGNFIDLFLHSPTSLAVHSLPSKLSGT